MRLRAVADRLLNQITHWTPSRWTAAASSGVSRAEVLHALAQRLADLAADAEGEPRRVVPRLRDDTALPHQIAVLANDLLAAGADPTALDAAATAIGITARDLD